MRVSVIAPLVTPLRAAQLGGAQTAVCELSRGLVAAGDEVELYAARGSRVHGVPLRSVSEAPFAEDLLSFSAVPSHHRSRLFPTSGDRDQWSTRQAGAFLGVAEQLRRRHPDVVHAHAFDWPAFYALAATGLPVVHTLHLLPIARDVVAAAVEARRHRPRPRFVAGSAACAVAWRQHVGEVRVIPFGVDASAVVFRGQPQRDLAIVAGRISPEKGTHISITAAHRVGLRVLIAGPVYDPTYHREKVLPLVRRKQATWVGPVSRARLARLYGRAAVALVASRWDEPFGLVAVEANLAGTPVAGFHRGGLPEVVGSRGGVLTDDESARGLARAILEALSLDRVAVRRWTEQRHSRETMIDRYRSLYRSMVVDR